MDLRKDIYFYDTDALFPINGSLECLYVDRSSGIIYSWNGTSYAPSGAGSTPTGLNYQGLWDANANSPLITSSVGTIGDYYIVGTAGTTNINGINDWGIGDWIVFSSTGVWQKIDNSDKEGYNTIEDEGNPLTQRSTINFVGPGVSAADSGGKTVVTINGASGVFGIANTSGVYTFYSTLTLAMAAATSGQTIEMFADVTESGAITVTLKNNVTINGNGHTYSYTNTANNCFIDNGIAVDCQILNLKIVRQAATSTGHIFLITSGSSKIDFTGSYLFYNVVTPGSFYALHNQTAATILNAYAVSTGTALFSQGSSTGQYINCFGQSTGSGNGISGNNIINSTGISVAGYGISVENAGTVINSTGISTSNTAIHGQLVRNSTAISTSGDGINGYYVVNSYARSSSGRAIAGWGNVGEFHGCVAESDSNNVANSNICKVYNSSCRTNWNNVNGHCLSRADIIVNSALFVTNSAANCIHYIAAFSCKYANNTFSGSTTPVNANITQAIVNTQDNQGNILL